MNTTFAPDYGSQDGDSGHTEIARLAPKRQSAEHQTQQQDSRWEPSIVVCEGHDNSAQPRE